MFSRLKNVFSRNGVAPAVDSRVDAGDTIPQQDSLAIWASQHGLSLADDRSAAGRFVLSGRLAGRTWTLERARSSKAFIDGDELRARAELTLRDDVVVIVMNRVLKEALEKQAYEIYTDSLQTTVDTSLPEEMRWLAMYEEVVPNGLSAAFVKRYAVMAHDQQDAVAWLTDAFVDLLVNWPTPAPSDETPFMVLIQRGKVFLRMASPDADPALIEHATGILEMACLCANDRFLV